MKFFRLAAPLQGLAGQVKLLEAETEARDFQKLKAQVRSNWSYGWTLCYFSVSA